MLEPARRPSDPGLGDLIEDALHQAKTLVQAEFSLARAELEHEVKQAFGSALLVALGAMCLQAALVTLAVLLVLALGAGAASAGVVLCLLALAASFLVFGVRALKRRRLPRTSERLSADAKQVLETVK